LSPSLPTVSVIIAAYNAESFIERAILSALQQTIPILEILVIDDASTDRTVAAVERIATTHDNVRLIALEVNCGPSVARNVGLESAQGDWIAVLDADDAFLPDRLAHLLGVARECEADIIVDAFRYYFPSSGTIDPSAFGDESAPPERVSLEKFLSMARPLGSGPDWGMLKPLFKSKFIARHGLRYPTKSRHGEDFLLLVETFLAGARYVFSRHAGYLYTDRSSGLSRTTVNYPLMWQHTEALMSDTRIQHQAGVLHALGERVEALKKLTAAREMGVSWRRRNLLAIAHRLSVDAFARTVLWEKIRRRLKGRYPRGTQDLRTR
jgi:succinoglycan biosynthesis protein ExoO